MALNLTSRQEAHDALIETSSRYVAEYMSHYDASHDFNHIQRVLALAKEICNAENSLASSSSKEEYDRRRSSTSTHEVAAATTTTVNGIPALPSEPLPEPPLKYNMTTVILAALLHDIGDRKYIDPNATGAAADPKTMVLNFLLSHGADQRLAEAVQTITTNVSYSSEVKNRQGVLEVIEQHPELAIVQDADRLDAIGAIGVGRCFVFHGAKRPGSSMQTAVEHFEDKLVKLEGMMKTETGKKMARVRTERILTFKKWFEEEAGVSSVQ